MALLGALRVRMAMHLSRRYITLIFVGWLSFGFTCFLCSRGYTGGAETFFFWLSLTSWALLPLVHLLAAVLIAGKKKSDPSLVATAGMLFAVLVFIAGLIGSGFSSYA
jgi:cytochrome bd-type quinol oxidase subunit 2